MTDRRLHDRMAVTLFVEYDGADDLVGDYTENLSQGGTFVLTPREIPVGTQVRLILGFAGLIEPIAVDALVRWSRDDEEQRGVGVEFLECPGREKLASIVKRIQTGDPTVLAPVIRVLVAEDNPYMSELIRDGLRVSAQRSFGGEVQFAFSTAEHGAEAIQLLRANRFDAAIIDVYLPVVEGPQVIQRARGELGLTDLPIIAVSGGGDAARDSALAAGANIFLDKPMRLRQVIETMRALVGL